MKDKRPATPGKSGEKTGKDDRLRAALRANLARRKQQARARTDAAKAGAGHKNGQDRDGDEN